MMPATLSIVTHAFPPEERGKAMGTWAGVSALALAVGPVRRRLPHRARQLAGDLLPQHPGRDRRRRRGAVRRARVARHRPSAARSTSPASSVLTAALTALILALVEGNAWGWGSTEIVALLAGAAVGLAAFVAIELRVKVPMVEFRFFSDRNFLGAVVVALIVSFAMLGVFFFLALYMQNILGYSPLEAGRQVPALDPDDRRRGAGRRAAGRPLRAALADRRRPAGASPPRSTASAGSRSTPATATCCPASCCSASASR